MTDKMRIQSVEEIRRMLKEHHGLVENEIIEANSGEVKMTDEKNSDLHAEMSSLYHRVEAAENKVRVFEDRFFNCLQMLQEIIDDPQRSGMLAQRGIDILKLGVLVLFKIPYESSPDYDSWSLTSLSYKTVKKYFPDWGCTYIYKKDPKGNDLHSIITHDEKVFKRMASKMTQVDDNRWEYIGHARDLVDD